MQVDIHTPIEVYEDLLDRCDSKRKVVNVSRKDLHDLLMDHHILYTKLLSMGAKFPEGTNIPVLAGGSFDNTVRPLPKTKGQRKVLDDDDDDKPVQRSRFDDEDDDVDNPPRKRNRL